MSQACCSIIPMRAQKYVSSLQLIAEPKPALTAEPEPAPALSRVATENVLLQEPRLWWHSPMRASSSATVSPRMHRKCLWLHPCFPQHSGSSTCRNFKYALCPISMQHGHLQWLLAFPVPFAVAIASDIFVHVSGSGELYPCEAEGRLCNELETGERTC